MSCHVNITSPIILYQPKRRKSFLQKLRNYSRKLLLSITECNEFISGIFTRNKKDGSKRMILSLKNFNMFVKYKHFKMESIIGLGMSCQPHKSRKRKLRRAMKSPPKVKLHGLTLPAPNFV